MIQADKRSPFYLLRELFQDALGLAPGLTDKRRVLALLLVRRSDESIFVRCGELVAWIGADKLARAMRCDRRTVQRGLSWLLGAGIIEVDRKGGGRARSTRYRFSKHWLGATAVQLENCGIAEAYGLPDDLFAVANGGTYAAVAARFGGDTAADGWQGAGAGGRNSGMAAAVPGANSGMIGGGAENSGAGAALSGQNSGAFSDGDGETAALASTNCGNSAGNCGAALPPEIDLNNRNRGARASKTAAGQNPDRRQRHLPLPISGGRSAAEDSQGYPGAERNRGWHPRIVQRAAEILGDAQRAALAVEWLEDAQKERLRDGYRPTPEELEKWLGWALDRADGAGDVAPAGGLPPDLAQAVQLAAQQAVRDVLPSIVPTLIQALQQQLQGDGAGTVAA
ncbi:hypothetical protein GBZ48_21500 [Azospirillum melinis]|uniref:Helix-turn-helix domain-containing protein n=1 Tax=Azospirillum melinis TaxID=328839 RepID=A0ABX2KE11_9PROT|nr:hypothetical protein [Azospirillum melinis]MBP2309409.1 DNA-binding transcriptional ArsR family regulator [Azospirillum melinis]NUB01833.1 hypothetical protein [Azospirillum melinis]